MQTLLSKLNDAYTRQWSPRTQSILSDHFTYLLTAGNVHTVVITEHQSIKFEGDFWGLLLDLGIPPTFHPFITYVNGYAHPADYAGTAGFVIIPDHGEMELILKINSTNTI